MEYENEITVEVSCDLETLIKLLEDKGFRLKRTCEYDDIYLINKNEKNGGYLSMLNKCVLIRSIIEGDCETKFLTYKHKEFDNNNDIIKQGKIMVSIDNVDNTKSLFEHLNFEELIRIKDDMLIYANDKDELAIQNVNNKHLYIEIEEKNSINRVYSSIDEMKSVIIDNSIPIKENNFFVKKAEIELSEKYS